ncbi:uncharacterized protein [Nicotiana tomentosiformis]|uniref:uncharacterized protein n=1 Tax=Nicotiana tomentosiformis TaxID=4098 RepID=UPI00388CEC00
MKKCTRSNENSTKESVDLRELMQKLIVDVGALSGEVSNLKYLDQTVHELKEQLSNSRNLHKDKSPLQNKCELSQFFAIEKVDAEEKVEVAAMHLEGEAIQWHLSFMRYKQYLQPATWNEYVIALVERFGVDFDDLMKEIKKIKQTVSVKEYQAIFERNLNRVRRYQGNAISYFIGCLKHELNIDVKLTNPTTLSQVYRTTRVGFTKRTLSIDKMNEKRAKGLCYFYNEKYTPDPELVKHLGCTVKSTNPQLVAATNENMMVDKVCTITWLLQGTEFSTEFLLLPLGSCRVVLEVQWLLTLGDIKKNFMRLTMEFWYKGRKHFLRGAGSQVKVQGADKLVKHAGDLSQLCMIHVVPLGSAGEQWHAIKVEEEPKTNARLVQLLVEYPSVKKDIIEGLVQQMLDQGIIQPSCSPFASPMVLVGKKDGSWRLCVSYRNLNKYTLKNKFTIPPIVEDLLDELGGSKIFSKIDLSSGYHQLRMAKEDVPKIAFRTHSGHFEYLVMPFGLSNAPAIFQGLMNFIFQKFLIKYVLVFFDDIFIYSSTIEDHLIHLRSVFVEMSKHQFFAKKSKCFSGVQRIEYLGYLITTNGLRGFLGLTGYYRRFIKGFGVICKPLTDLTKNDVFKLSTSADATFVALKKALTQAPILALPDTSKTFIMETNAVAMALEKDSCMKGIQ